MLSSSAESLDLQPAGLQRAGVGSALLFEREARLFSHSSGRNAAIYRTLETLPCIATLVYRSAVRLDGLLGSRAAWLQPNGLILIARDERSLEPLSTTAHSFGARSNKLDRDELHAVAPILRNGDARVGLATDRAGVLDGHAIETGLCRAFSSADGIIQRNAAVSRIETRGGRVNGVVLADGGSCGCDAVVIAAGAWAAGLGESCGFSRAQGMRSPGGRSSPRWIHGVWRCSSTRRDR